MKTKREILHELIHEEHDLIQKDAEKFDMQDEKEILEATKSGDLGVLIAYNLASAIASENSKIQDIMKSESERKVAMFRTIFIAIKLMRKTEEKYAKQFNVGKENENA